MRKNQLSCYVDILKRKKKNIITLIVIGVISVLTMIFYSHFAVKELSIGNTYDNINNITLKISK